jgi:hypothetical protein
MPQGAKVVVKITEGRKIVHAVGAKVTYDETLWSALTNQDIAPNIQPTMCNLQSCRRSMCR